MTTISPAGINELVERAFSLYGNRILSPSEKKEVEAFDALTFEEKLERIRSQSVNPHELGDSFLEEYEKAEREMIDGLYVKWSRENPEKLGNAFMGMYELMKVDIMRGL